MSARSCRSPPARTWRGCAAICAAAGLRRADRPRRLSPQRRRSSRLRARRARRPHPRRLAAVGDRRDRPSSSASPPGRRTGHRVVELPDRPPRRRRAGRPARGGGRAGAVPADDDHRTGRTRGPALPRQHRRRDDRQGGVRRHPDDVLVVLLAVLTLVAMARPGLAARTRRCGRHPGLRARAALVPAALGTPCTPTSGGPSPNAHRC